MPTIIDIVEPECMRYNTAGDWFAGEDGSRIIVAQTGNPDYNLLIAIHEIVEAYLCNKAGITDFDVDAWDLKHPSSSDPAMLPGSPYREQHIDASRIEMALAGILGVDWNKYDDVVRSLYGGKEEERATEEGVKPVQGDV